MLPDRPLFGDESTYPACRTAARGLRSSGARALEVRGAALLPGCAHGWIAESGRIADGPRRDGLVWVIFGSWPAVGWIVVEDGAPPAAVLPLVRAL